MVTPLALPSGHICPADPHAFALPMSHLHPTDYRLTRYTTPVVPENGEGEYDDMSDDDMPDGEES